MKIERPFYWVISIPQGDRLTEYLQYVFKHDISRELNQIKAATA